MRCGLSLTKSTTGECITQMATLSRTASMATERLGPPSPSGRVAKAVPEEDESATDLINRYAKQIVGAVSASGYSETASLRTRNPFKIPNTFEPRAAIGPVQDRIRDQRIAIIGLGGTGAYVLDLVAKTPVMEIHLLDSDHMNWHNFMRAPSAPTAEEVELRHKARLRKVDYYYSLNKR